MTGQEGAPAAQRMILNSNQGVTNIIESSVIRKDMSRVTDSIFDMLKSHYGPYSMFAGLDSNRPLEDTVFTKDGANIIRSVEFVSPLEDWVRRAIAYVGGNIEKSSGDGTTSSMMFACGMLKHMNEHMDELKPIGYNEFRTRYNEFVATLRDKYISSYTLSAKNKDGKYDRDKVYTLAYAQAYTSSHGNKELAKAVATMFKNTPAEMWGKMRFERRKYESDKNFEVQKSEGQYQLECEIMTKTTYNMDLKTWLKYDDCKLLVLNDSIRHDDPHWKIIEDAVKASNKEHPVAILCYDDFDNYTFGELMHLSSDSNLCFSLFSIKREHPTANDLVVIQAVAGFNVLQYAAGEFAARPAIKEHVNLTYKHKKLTIDGLYQDDREDTGLVRYRPYYDDKTHPFFRELADTYQKTIDAYEAIEMTRTQQMELFAFQKAYNKLCFDRQYVLVIGGHTFDNLAMFDVVDDVIRATIRTLEIGCVPSNNKALYWACKDYLEFLGGLCEAGGRCLKIYTWFAKRILETLDQFSDVVLDMLYPKGYIPNSYELHKGNHGCFIRRYFAKKAASTKTDKAKKEFREWWFGNVVDLLEYDPYCRWGAHVNNDKTYSMSSLKGVGFLYNAENFIVQPSNADTVMLERFGEIALKFIMTERVIVSGSAYLKDKKGTK